MRVAIVHDYIKEYGGAERVLEALHEVFPKAPIYTLVYLPKFLGPHRQRFSKMDIRPSFLQNVPFKGKLISPFRLIAPSVFKSFDFSKYDLIIVSATGAYNPNVINKKKAILVCYCHTPPRYLYGFATARNWKKNKLFRVVGEVANHFLRITDFNSSKNVDFFIANSHNVAKRIDKFYGKKSKVIYPPVDVSSNSKEGKSGEYFLTGGRLARPKHTDLIIKAFASLKLPLKVFGKAFAGYGDELINLAGKNVEFLGEVNDEKKKELMNSAKAFVFASEDEDFGIIPVEAMAAGIPVIAHKSGGVLETVVEGKTGVFFDNLTEESLKKAVLRLNKMKINREECRKQAQKFNRERFKKEIKNFALSKVK
jgi:glycosyltransferase involved in cell wall biosynthesis